MRNFAATLSLLVTSAANQAYACSCTSHDGTAESYNVASAAVVAEVRLVNRSSRFIGPGSVSRWFSESAVFEVVKVWKGAQLGQRFEIISELGPGACGISAINDPIWLEDIPALPEGKSYDEGESDGRVFAANMSGQWIVFGYGDPPVFRTDHCSGAIPLIVSPVQPDVELLDRLPATE